MARRARAHWLFVCLLLLGAMLRVGATVAYRPALLAADSASYLQLSLNLEPNPMHPAGYPAFLNLLRAVPGDGSLTVVPLVQHLLGMGAAALLYAVQLRLGVRRWLAAVAVSPVLLDAYWLNLEQYVMSEAMTLALLVVACAALLWRQPVGALASGAAGLALAGATMTRTVAVIVMLPAAFALVARAGKGSRSRALLAFVIAGALPLAAYAAWFHAENGRYALAGHSGHYLYGRIATFVDCSAFRVPAKERALCPEEPLGQRWHPYYYVWFEQSPYRHIPKNSRERLAGRFAERAIINQPLDYARTVAEDVLRGFAPVRRTTRPGEALWRWQFQPHHPFYVRTREPPYIHAVLCGTEQPDTAEARSCEASRAEWTRVVERFGDDELTVEPTLARWLTTYRGFAFVPGPLLVLALALGVAGALAAGRRRETSLWTACFLVTAMAAILVVVPIARLHFAWRYEILAFVLIPVCGSIGLTALVPRWRHESGPADPS